jgi:hypothetical protein
MESKPEFIELVGEMLNHPEMDMSHVIQGLCEILLEKMAKDADEDSARVWLLLTKAIKLLETGD